MVLLPPAVPVPNAPALVEVAVEAVESAVVVALELDPEQKPAAKVFTASWSLFFEHAASMAFARKL